MATVILCDRCGRDAKHREHYYEVKRYWNGLWKEFDLCFTCVQELDKWLVSSK